MKRLCAALLTLLIMFSFCGCQEEIPVVEGPAFYYCTAELNFSMDSKAIQAEQRAVAQSATLEEILSLYLSGPHSEKLRSPFPTGLQIVEVYVDQNRLCITLNDTLTALSGLDLTLACCCLTLTGMELTGAEQVVISADGALLNGQKSITMNKECLLLLDTVLEGE